jgi:hypothetical protein
MVTLKRVAELPTLRSLGASDGFKGVRRKTALGQGKVGLPCRRVSEPSQLWTDPEERCAIGAIAHGQGHGISHPGVALQLLKIRQGQVADRRIL